MFVQTTLALTRATRRPFDPAKSRHAHLSISPAAALTSENFFARKFAHVDIHLTRPLSELPLRRVRPIWSVGVFLNRRARIRVHIPLATVTLCQVLYATLAQSPFPVPDSESLQPPAESTPDPSSSARITTLEYFCPQRRPDSLVLHQTLRVPKRRRVHAPHGRAVDDLPAKPRFSTLAYLGCEWAIPAVAAVAAARSPDVNVNRAARRTRSRWDAPQKDRREQGRFANLFHGHLDALHVHRVRDVRDLDDLHSPPRPTPRGAHHVPQATRRAETRDEKTKSHAGSAHLSVTVSPLPEMSKNSVIHVRPMGSAGLWLRLREV